MRRCSTCGLTVDEGVIFNKSKVAKDGLSSRCKECNKQYLKQYYQAENGKAVIRRNLQSEKYRKYRKKYIKTDQYKASINRYQQTDKYKEYVKKHRKSAQAKATRKRYSLTGKPQKTAKEYRQTKRYKELRSEYKKSGRQAASDKRYQERHKISCRLSAGIRHSLKGNKNGHHWEDLVGWTLQQFKNRFNQLFEAGMTWENHGVVWEIDHIVPLSVHNITSINCMDFKRAWKLSNLQPLFKEENRFKSNKLQSHFQPTLF
ncbi:MAG: hypothetical protein KAS66_01305 [Candidatus Omnitrophica bacterium]|nr:hypothetical protein [Candidatus Omnitrophota bacterium]